MQNMVDNLQSLHVNALKKECLDVDLFTGSIFCTRWAVWYNATWINLKVCPSAQTLPSLYTPIHLRSPSQHQRQRRARHDRHHQVVIQSTQIDQFGQSGNDSTD